MLPVLFVNESPVLPMTLLAILIALFLATQRWVPAVIRERRWLRLYLVWFERVLRARRWPVGMQFIAYLVPMGVLAWLTDVPLPGHIARGLEVAVAVLLLCSALDYRLVENRLRETVKRWHSQDWEAVRLEGKKYWGYGRLVQPTEIVNQTLIRFLVRTNQGLFSPIFWYVLFGSSGLMCYVLSRVAARNRFREKNGELVRVWRRVAFEFLQVLDGFAARVLVFTLSILSFNVKGMAIAFRRFRASDREADMVLRMAARVVLNFHEWPETPEAIASEGAQRAERVLRLRRILLMGWLLVLALFTIARLTIPLPFL
ncbi:hypothetical protein HDN1F_07680 [gamma proteobacterium HdN1]|nr:hypothetical protein HDN1F_07680 [gamma proteobacterium HdN1]